MDPNPETNVRVGYRRSEMWSESLVGTVKQHDCHAFLVHGDAVEWPGKEFESTPGSSDVASPAIVMHDALRAASGTYKGGIHKFEKGTNAVGSVKLNLAEAPGAAGGVAGDNLGDVLLFPQMRRHRLGSERAKDPKTVAAFVQKVIVAETETEHEADSLFAWDSIASFVHVFVCTHGARDARCGVCGPALVDAFRAAVASDSALAGKVLVRGCSHVGGHAYAGNVLVFAPRDGVGGTADVFGAWYGYVTPREVEEILRRTIRKGEIIPRLWRGSLGMAPDAHAEAASAAAAAIGEPWPPEKTPCDACAEANGVGDVEDIGVDVKPTATKKFGAADVKNDDVSKVNSASVSSGLEKTFMTTAAAGALGLVASLCWTALER